MKLSRKIISGILATSFAVAAFTGCTSYDTGDEKVYSYDEAVTELEAFNKEIKGQISSIIGSTKYSAGPPTRKVVCAESISCSLCGISLSGVIYETSE